jgi:hypothetical protein
MLNLLLLPSLTSIGLIAAVIVFLGLAWLVVAVPVVLLVGGCSEEMAKVMAARDLPNVPVTTSAGDLIGLLVREDVERAVHERRGGPS